MTAVTDNKVPVRILLQVRDGEDYNVLGQGFIRSFSEREEYGVKVHDVVTEDVIGVLASVMRSEVRKIGSDSQTKTWLRRIHKYIFD